MRCWPSCARPATTAMAAVSRCAPPCRKPRCANSARSPTRSPGRAARRWRWRRTAGCSASSTSRTSSRAASSERFAELRRMGIRTVMITGDNPLTAAAIAAEVGRRRLPRPGDAGDQAQADPRRAGAGQAGGDVRRRHQRRAGAGAGRCRRGDEHRHHGGARGRQHGRPRQRPDQADRDRRDRQAAADDARRADHVLASPTTWRSTSPSSRRCSSRSIRSSRR